MEGKRGPLSSEDTIDGKKDDTDEEGGKEVSFHSL